MNISRAWTDTGSMSDLYQLLPLDPAVDVDELLALRRLAHGQEAELLGIPADAFPPLQQQRWELQASNESHLGAWRGGRLVGAISWAADDDDPAAQWISSLVVDPAEQRQGVATRLLYALDQLNRGRPLTIWVMTGNTPALGFAKAMGFAQLGLAQGRIKLRRSA